MWETGDGERCATGESDEDENGTVGAAGRGRGEHERKGDTGAYAGLKLEGRGVSAHAGTDALGRTVTGGA